jgi:hypothetical protein
MDAEAAGIYEAGRKPQRARLASSGCAGSWTSSGGVREDWSSEAGIEPPCRESGVERWRAGDRSSEAAAARRTSGGGCPSEAGVERRHAERSAGEGGNEDNAREIRGGARAQKRGGRVRAELWASPCEASRRARHLRRQRTGSGRNEWSLPNGCFGGFSVHRCEGRRRSFVKKSFLHSVLSLSYLFPMPCQ